MSQKTNNWLQEKLRNADSVILVSHNVTAGVTIVDDSTGIQIPLPKLLLNNKLNYQIVKEKQIIKNKQLDKLVSILTRPFEDKEIEMAKCFMPHHAILIIKNGKTSFIEICFGCHRFETSKDLARLYAFDKRKWIELERYFSSNDFKYEL